MNCTPGDVAVIARVDRERDRPYIGTVLRVVRVVQWDRGRAYWSFADCPTLERAGMHAVCDLFLRALRDTDGVDETLVGRAVPMPLQLQAQMRAAEHSWRAVTRLAEKLGRRTRGRAA